MPQRHLGLYTTLTIVTIAAFAIWFGHAYFYRKRRPQLD